MRTRYCGLATTVCAAAAMCVSSEHVSAQCDSIFTTSSGGVIVPGVTDTGNHCDDCTTLVQLPFAWSLYGVSYNSVNVSSNGNLQFTTTNGVFGNTCPLPAGSFTGATIMPHWDDLRTDGAGNGIFTSTTGSAPDRIFNIEYRATYFSGGGSANFQVRLFEGRPRYDMVYGQVDQNGSSATIGMQAGAAGPFLSFSCNTASITPGLVVTFGCSDSLLVSMSAPAAASAGDTILLVGIVTPGRNPDSTGIQVTGNLSAIGGSATQMFFDDGTNGDATAGDNRFSYRATIPNSQNSGNANLSVFVQDAQMRSATNTATVQVFGRDILTEGTTDAGELPDTARRASGSTGNLGAIIGTIDGVSDADMYRIRICNPSAFSANTTAQVAGALEDTQLFLFDANGRGVASNDDHPTIPGNQRSVLGPTRVTAPGVYYIAISGYNRDPFSDGGLIWLNSPFNTERSPDGPGASLPVSRWESIAATGGNYRISLTGVCFLEPDACVADVDNGSGTGTPDGGVTIDDLLYYLSIFEAGNASADVDDGTMTGTSDGGVTIEDLLYYLFRYEAGC